MPFETVFLGVVIALLYTEITGVYPGGIIVPAFLSLTLDQPVRPLATLGAACLSLLIYKLASRYFILFGRRRFVVMILLGGFWTQLWLLIAPSLSPAPAAVRVLGLVIPGLLANNLERQKFFPTLASLVTVTVIIYLLGNILKMIVR
jgi:poly-gamma-glutamate biosynthesis protein PgsC/CapC